MSDWKKIENGVASPKSSDAFRAPAEAPENEKPGQQASSDGTGAAHEASTNKTASDVTTGLRKTTEKAEPPAAFGEDEAKEPAGPVVSPGFAASGARKRRRRSHAAAPVGFVILLLAVVGLVSLAAWGVQSIRRATDDTGLKTELTDFLLPVSQYNPSAFTTAQNSDQDALLLAAIWRVTDAERIRLLRNENSASNYAVDDLGRMLIPISEIEDSYAYIFGKGMKPKHHTIGEEGQSFTVEYDEAQGVYHVPSAGANSIYVAVIDTLKRKGDTYQVRMGYVLITKLARDEKGELIDPTPDMADYYQVYTVQKLGGNQWKLVSVSGENGVPVQEASDGGTAETGSAAEEEAAS